MQLQDIILDIKRDFYSFRNGIVSDAIRKLYPPKTMILGLNVPQFIELAKKYPKDLKLGLELWKDKTCRESRLFSLYILPPEEVDYETAKEMIKEVNSTEEAEFLAFKILRRLPFATELLEEIIKEEISQPLPSYCISMFKKNLDQI